MELLVLSVLLISMAGLFTLVILWQRSEKISRREAREWLLSVLDARLAASTARNAIEFVEARRQLDEEIPPAGRKKERRSPSDRLSREIDVDGGGKATIFSTVGDPALFGDDAEEDK